MTPETSIIIRTKNEEKWLGTVLEKLFNQTYKDFEVIIVDSGSSDKTLEIAKQFLVKILQIPAQSFSYPLALNYAIRNASGSSKFVVIMSAHSIPISNTWLDEGIKNLEEDKMVAGVFGFIDPLPNASFWDKIFIKVPNLVRGIRGKQERQIIQKSGMGVLGFTNAIIRKDLWEKYPFNEQYGAGGEDGEWAAYWLSRGYHVIRDRKFTVLHSHHLSLAGWYRQWKYWKSLAKPRPFEPLSFRKSPTHAPIK